MNNSTPYTPEDIIKMIDFKYQTRDRVNKIVYFVSFINLDNKSKNKIFKKSCEKNLTPLIVYFVKNMSSEERVDAISYMVNKNYPIDFSISNYLNKDKINELLNVATSFKNYKNIDRFKSSLVFLEKTNQSTTCVKKLKV